MNLIREIFRNHEVIHQASPDWLGLQRIDIFIPELKLAIEYQGKQHYEPIDFFGGIEGFKRNKERDERKAILCKENNIDLIYFKYDEEINKNMLMNKLRKYL